ncbi:hypothetical protein HHK36_026105 [Tetracentron sinense]|uniref:PGG domain-containing protein n=1 Tax=Tetracentron sinense TaxID=13715 RepID=A0A834YK20_TETSI|nr:hypothetical protein HHK36_026105 [Tetracentron sinense]
MDRRLYEASRHGSVHSLNDLLEENELILHRVSTTCLHETPLHIAAMLGHFDFVRAVLFRNPKLASELDSQGCSPLHFASAEGYVDIVRELLKIDTAVCSVGDQYGRTPLHLAAAKGRVDVLKELVQARPEVTGIKADNGENALHFCVEHSRLEALKVLVESVTDDEFINSKDGKGNTVLHLAAAKKQLQAIKYLLTKIGILELNSLNCDNFTAIDVVEQYPSDLQGKEVEESLRGAGALRARDLRLAVPNTEDIRGNEISLVIAQNDVVAPSVVPQNLAQPPSHGKILENHFKNDDDWWKRKRETLMVAATVIAAMALQVGLNPPGGVWQEDSKEIDEYGDPEYSAGTSILAYNNPMGYPKVMAYNTVSFVVSLSIVLSLVSGVPFKRRIITQIQTGCMWITITFMTLTYLAAMDHIAPEHEDKVVNLIIWISVIVWIVVTAILFLFHFVRLFLKWIRKESH